MTAPSARIMLIDDDPLDAELAMTGFREIGSPHCIHHIGSGQAAINYLTGTGEYADRGEFPIPDLIMLDLKMPGIDGFAVLQNLKSRPELRRLPVIIFSNSRDDDDRRACYDHGANSYLVKPTTYDGVVDVCRQVEAYWLALNLGPPT